MRISDLPQLPQPAKEILQNHGIKELNPAQDAAVSAGLLSGKSLVVCAPTASGKTLIAELAFLNIILNQKKKAIYLVPLKALGSEKYRDFKEKYNALGIKVALSMGDYDSREARLADNDIIIATSEKMDSLLRHKADWVSDVGLLIVDEIHLLNDTERGPTLEVVIARINALLQLQILGLSATIRNANEIANWLNAELVKSDYRPVKLSKGVFYGNKIEFENDDVVSIPDDKEPLFALIKYILSSGKQALIFVKSRSSAEAQAEKIISIVREFSSDNKDTSEKILNALDHPTRQCERLARCILGGVAFHHAGLVDMQKEIVEDGFKTGKIRIIAATPTLAVGLNLPSTYVIVRDTSRFQGNCLKPLPVLEIEQMLGRAGRPRYDKEGYALIVAKDSNEAKRHLDNYLHGKPEYIFSKLGSEPALQRHILSIIATGDAESEEAIIGFLSKTFYTYQYSDMAGVRKTVTTILLSLAEYGLITLSMPSSGIVHGGLVSGSGPNIRANATEIGRRVTKLYIEPETAHLFLDGIKRLTKNHPLISFLQLIAYVHEFNPSARLKAADSKTILSDIDTFEHYLVISKENIYTEEKLYASIKSALLLEAWIAEENEDIITEKFGVPPGEFHRMFANADWLLYSLQQLCVLLPRLDIYKPLDDLRIRVKYGVKAELLDLVRIRGIGRVKARKLFRLGVKSIDNIKNINYSDLEKVVGPKMAKRLRENAMQGIEKMPVEGDFLDVEQV